MTDVRTFYLKRVNCIEDGVFGVLLDGDIPFAVTIERPWWENKKNKSCIPAGYYLCKRIKSNKATLKKGAFKGETFRVTEVPHRTKINFHIGNTKKDITGCIGVAEKYGELKNKIAILGSEIGFRKFMQRVKGIDEFYLSISDYF